MRSYACTQVCLWGGLFLVLVSGPRVSAPLRGENPPVPVEDAPVPGRDCNGNGVDDARDLGVVVFDPPQPLATGRFPVALAVGDVDRDGGLDIVATNADGLGWSLEVHSSAGIFLWRTMLGLEPGALTLADVDGDGWLDALIAHPLAYQLTVLFNNRGDFIAPQRYTVGRGPAAIVVSNIDDDGVLDIVTANELSRNVTILFGDGGGVFPLERRVEIPTGPSSSPVALVTTDLDDDGRLDVATANSQGGSVTVLFQNATGRGDTFTQHRIALGDGTYPIGIVAGDIDGDGAVDLATADVEANTVTWLRNQKSGARSFIRQIFSGGEFPQALVAFDFEADGDLDLVTLNSDTQDIVVHVNDGTGDLSLIVRTPASRGRLALAAADLDGDNDIDLVTADGRGGTLTVFPNASQLATATDQNHNGVPDTCDPEFQRGDCNGDRRVGELADVLFLLYYLFLGDDRPGCTAACDFDGDGGVEGNLGDAIYLLTFKFLGGPAPRAPFGACGVGGKTDDALGCDQVTCP